MTSGLSTLLKVKREEVIPLLLAAFFFFCVLTALMVLRPARDALGMQRGIDAVRWLFLFTALVTLLVNPVFGWMVSRLRRARFIAISYLFFAASLVGFYLLLALAPEAVGQVSGQVFYVWFSVFNLFSTMVFWALMADRFSLEQSKRLFGLIAIGGTLGAIFGPWLASVLAAALGTPRLLLVSAGFLMLGLLSTRAVTHTPAASASADDTARIGGSAWEGLKAVFRSPYLLGIAGYVIAMSIVATLLYFTRLQMVANLESNVDMRTSMFAQIDFYTQVATLLLQALIAGRLMKRFGVAITLTLLPLTVMLGFIGLAMVSTLTVLILFEAAFRAIQRALTRPARETLYTVVSREDKYKSKAFIDTFGYRGGDVIGAQVEGLLGRLGLGIAGLTMVALPIALLWAALGLWLGREQQRIASGQCHDASAAQPSPSSRGAHNDFA